MKVYDIPLRLPGINEYQAACRRHPLAGARMKRDAVQRVMTYLVPVVKLAWPIQAEIYYTEPNKKRDVDNVCGFGAKVILDALVKAGLALKLKVPLTLVLSIVISQRYLMNTVLCPHHILHLAH